MRRPHILVVAQALKGSLSATEVASACEEAVQDAGGIPNVLIGSDGGDGLLDALRHEVARHTTSSASDPLGRPIAVRVGWLGSEEAVVESRLVIGLALLADDERDPLRATTRGVGEIIGQLADMGARRVYLGLGGSATVDAGTGMARIWGWLPRDSEGAALPEGGGALSQLATLDQGSRPPVEVVGLADVRNRLLGPEGALVYAPQKGANEGEVELLGEGLENLARVASAMSGGEGVAELEGSGAAGGLGFGVVFFAGGKLERGARWVLDRIGFAAALSEADLVMTCEGAFDSTSLSGKLTGEVLGRASVSDVPSLLLSPAVSSAPEGVVVQTGGGHWSTEDLCRQAREGIIRALRLPP